MSEHREPPIGVVPRFIVAEQRVSELCHAIMRYASAGLPVSRKWVTELSDLTAWLRIHHQRYDMNNEDGAASVVRSDALLGCPFCGRHAPGPASGVYMITANGGQAVRCPTCNAHGPLCPTFDQAVSQWNQRKPNNMLTVSGGRKETS